MNKNSHKKTFQNLNLISTDNTGHGEAQYKMGVICQQNGHFQEAIDYYEKGINCHYISEKLFYNLAICYHEINEIDHAIDSFFRAIEIKKDFHEAIKHCCHLCLKRGKELQQNQRVDEAIQLYLKCLCFSSGDQLIALLHYLVSAYAVKGDITNALKCSIRSLELDPMNSLSYSQLSQIKKFTSEDITFIKQMELLVNQYKKENEDDQLNLCWALAKAYDDINNFNKAFSYYKKANAIHSKKMTYSIKDIIRFRDQLISIFEQSHIYRLSSFGNKSTLPIFIVGHNRTGTTLLANKLSMLDNVYSAGELDFFNQFVSGYPNNIPEVTKNNINELSEKYLSILNNVSEDAIRVIDKMPTNFAHIGWILTLFPNATIIHCKRHPLDTCLSNFFMRYAIGNKFTYDLNQMAMYFKAYEPLMKFWYKLFKDNIYTIYYEHLILHTETVGKKLVNWLGLEWKNDFLSHQKNTNITYTCSLWQARQKIFTSSLYRWKNYEHLIREIMNYLSNEIIEYEHELSLSRDNF
jgi:tetratricopeptide (TPR) repeat protein